MLGESTVFPPSRENRILESKYLSLFEKLFSSKLLFRQPARLETPYSWVDHIPSAFFLTEILQPGIFVELGVHSGNSFNAFCQAVDTLGLSTKVYGVDTWEGDEHAGEYAGSAILARLDRYTQDRYPAFANLMKMTFNDAREYFSDGSIDLLHIDGYHTYEAAANDFYAWLPKMSKRGVVLLHDTTMRRANFGVWRLLEELSEKYPITEFNYGFGLGVVITGEEAPSLVQDLVRANAEISFFRDLWGNLGRGLRVGAEGLNARKQIEELQIAASKSVEQITEIVPTVDFSLMGQLSDGSVKDIGHFSLISGTKGCYFECLMPDEPELAKIVIRAKGRGFFSHYGIEILDLHGKPIVNSTLLASLARTATSFLFSGEYGTIFSVVLNQPTKVSAFRGHGRIVSLTDDEAYAEELKVVNSLNQLNELKQRENLSHLLNVGQEQGFSLLAELSAWKHRLVTHGDLLEQHISKVAPVDIELKAMRGQLYDTCAKLEVINDSKTNFVTEQKAVNIDLEQQHQEVLLKVEELLRERLRQEERLKDSEFQRIRNEAIISEVFSSKSWKLTAPLRYLMSFIK